MSSFLDRILSGRYPKMESIWRTEFERIVDEVFGRLGDELKDVEEPADSGLDDEFDETAVEAELNTTIEALRADLNRVEGQLVEEKLRHEAAKRELGVAKAELRSARYKLDAIGHALDRAGSRHAEPLG